MSNDLEGVSPFTASDLPEFPPPAPEIFRSLVESIQDGLLVLDRDWRLVFVNERAARNVGHSPADLTGKNMWEAFPNLVGGEMDRHLHLAMETRQVARFEYKGILTGKWYELRAYPAPDGGLVVYWLDNTENTQARLDQEQLSADLQQSLLQTREWALKTTVMLDSLTEAVILYDQNGQVERANARAVEILGYHPAGRSYHDIYTGVQVLDDRGVPIPFKRLPIARAYRGETIQRERITLQRSDQRRFVVLASARPIHIEGQFNGVITVWNDITTVEQLNAENQRQQLLLETIFENAPIGIAIYDGPEFVYRLANTRYLSYIGKSKEIIGQSVRRVWDDQMDLFSPLDQVYSTGRPYEVTDKYIFRPTPDGGREEYYSYSYTPLFGPDGRVSSILLLTQETSDRVKAQQETEIERARLNAIVSYAPVGIVVSDAQARVIYTNQTADRLYARPVPDQQEFESHAVMQICYPDGTPCPPRDLPLTRSALDGIVMTNIELQIVWPDGQHRPLLINTAPILSSDGQVQGAVGIFQDITERKQVEQALQEGEERLRLAVSAANLTLFGMDSARRYRWIYTGSDEFDPNSLIGKTDEDHPLFDQLAELISVKQSVLDTGVSVQSEITVQVRGEERTLLLMLNPLYDRSGAVDGLVGASLNITTIKKMEKEMTDQHTRLEVSRLLLQHSEHERMQIARDLHDGPIQEFIGLRFNLSHALQSAGDSPVRDLLERLTEDLNHYINNLRAFMTGLRSPVLAEFGLRKALLGYLQSFKDQNPEIQIDFMIQTDLTPDEEVSTTLYRICQELLTNVVKHSHATRVDLSLLESNGQLVLEVQDDGEGFELPANWIDLPRQQHYGIIGMLERAEAVGGRLTIETAPGQGCRVEITIPV